MNYSHINRAIIPIIASVGFSGCFSTLWAQTPESLDRLIQQSITKGGFSEARMNELMPAWEGMQTKRGVNLVLDRHLLRDGSPEINLACSYLLRNRSLSSEEMVSVMMDRAKYEARNEDEPWRLVYVLRKMEEIVNRKEQGKEVVPFIASFLNDRRPTEPSRRGPEAVPRQQRRVCDGATSALINFMEDMGLCDKYDTRFGNPGGEAMWERRDQVIQEVVKLLQGSGFLPNDFWSKLPPARVQATNKPNLAVKATVSASSMSQASPETTLESEDLEKTKSSMGDKAVTFAWWLLGSVVVAALFGLLRILLKKRKQQR